MEIEFRVKGFCHFELAASSLKMMYGRAFGFEFATEPSGYKPTGGRLWEVVRSEAGGAQLYLRYGGVSLLWGRPYAL